MQKTDLTSFIAKYFLAGACKDARWEIADKNLYVDFMTDEGALLGTVVGNVDLEDNVLAVMDAKRLTDILNALGDEVTGQYEKSNDKTLGITFSDGKSKAYFKAGEMSRITDPNGRIANYRERGRQLSRPPAIALALKLEKEDVTRLLAAKRALNESKVVGLVRKADAVNFVVNFTQRNENNFTIPVNAEIIDGSAPTTFGYQIDLLASILTVNSDFRTSSIKVTNGGMMILAFVGEDYTSTYYLNPLDIV